MRRAAPLPPELRDVPFSTSSALRSGVGPSRLRRSDLSAPFHGVRTSGGTASDLLSLASVYAVRMPDREFFCHLTAAALLGLRLPERIRDVSTPLHVGTIAPARAPRPRGVTGHQLGSAAVVALGDGLRVTSPLTTWCQLARELTPLDLVVMGDGLVRRTAPLATAEEVDAAVRAWAGRPGAAKLRLALAQLRPGTDSGRETMLRLLLVRSGLPEPTVNHPVLNRFGAFIGFADLAYPTERVILEYDGGQHREDEKQFHRDIDRLDEFVEEGWRVIRVNKSLMGRSATLVAKVRAALAATR
jgi:hypothetical protein